MLILSRRPGESIIINNNIKITFLGNQRFNQGRLGIEAPSDISIHREEIQDKINKAKEDGNYEHD